MRSFVQSVMHFLQSEEGPTAVEYAAIISWVGLTCMTTVKTLSNKSTTTYNTVSNVLGNSSGS